MANWTAPLIGLVVDLAKEKITKKKINKDAAKEKAVEALSATLAQSPVTTGLGTASGVGALLLDSETLLQILPMIPADHHIWVLLGMYTISAVLILVGKKIEK